MSPRAANREPRTAIPGAEVVEPRTTSTAAKPAAETMSAYIALIPIVIVVLAGCAAMLGEAFRQRGERMPIAGFGLIGLGGSALASVLLWGSDAQSFGVIRSDNFALFINIVLCIIGVLTMLFSDEVVEREAIACRRVLRADAVCHLRHDDDGGGDRSAGHLPGARDAVAGGLRPDRHPPGERRRRRSGVQVLPARRVLERLLPLRRRVRLRAVRIDPARGDRRGAVGAGRRRSRRRWRSWRSGCSLVGFAFKVSAVPFHMWTPDAYEGAPTIVTAFMSTGRQGRRVRRLRARLPVAARAAAGAVDPGARASSPRATMILGTVVGVVQTNIKRMLAYSSIAHAGYLLLGIVATNSTGKAAVLFYLLAYAVSNLGALGIVALMGTAQHEPRRAPRFRWIVEVPPRPRGADDDVPAVARRLPADGRLHRQVVHLQRCGRARALLAGGDWRADQRRSRSSSTCGSSS